MLYSEIISRNAGIIGNQDCLKGATIALAGCGGAGGEAPVTLCRMGVGGLKLADPDVFEASNLNRQFGSSTQTIGKNKAEVISNTVKEVAPFCEVSVVSEGITETNIDEFLKNADIALEEIDFTKPYYTAVFHRAARKLKVPIMTALPVGWGAYLFFFKPDSLTFEEYVGLHKDCKLDDFKDYYTPLNAYSPVLPSYVDMELIAKIATGEAEIPAIAPAVNLTAGILASFVYFYLSGEQEIMPVPHYYSSGDMFLTKPRTNSLENNQ